MVTWMDLGSRFSSYIHLQLMIGKGSTEFIWDCTILQLRESPAVDNLADSSLPNNCQPNHSLQYIDRV